MSADANVGNFEPAITVFMLVKTMPEWLGMPIDQRFQELSQYLQPIVTRFKGEARMRFYDVEFYSTNVTDIWIWDARSHESYQLLVEALRETPFWDRYFQIVDILAGVENAYAKNYGRAPLAA
ncbi:darcynin family protein [Nitrospirillum iridis]|uniref:Darcynin n=1 Tax=Nitrospirillum iridis TaxID=765888 RepID=A0A7X0EG62_9PROT|nr:darcynin family protein [Nitrospirillum iridis]MBB6254655.1 hypothetical protein [Nitrospirillum iridis]